MVRLKISVRPKPGYAKPKKIVCIEVDTSQRVEEIVPRLRLDRQGTHFYSRNGRELPMNSSLASHNIQEGDVIETCACPEMSTVLSCVMNDFNAIDRLPECDRTEANVRPLLDGAKLDPWPDRWSKEDIKNRIICLATLKKALQRDDRYEPLRVIACGHDLGALRAFADQYVWKSNGRGHNTMAHIVKPSARNRDGQPTICWELLQNKLDKLRQLSFRLGPEDDAIDQFLAIQTARHTQPSTPSSTQRPVQSPALTATQPAKRRPLPPSTPNSSLDAKCSLCQKAADCVCLTSGCPFHENMSCKGCFEANHPVLQRNHERVPLRDRRAKGLLRRNNKASYVPEYASGPYSILSTLYEALQTRREYSLDESLLKKLAQRSCRSNLYDHQARGRNAFACIEALIEKNLLRKELIPGSDEAKYSLLPSGETMGQRCYEFDKELGKLIAQSDRERKQVESRSSVASQGIKMIIDDREDSVYASRFVERCHDSNISVESRSLPAGDYIFTITNDVGDEVVLPLVIERKSWSDLADSVTGKGRQRLDCVRLGGGNPCGGKCQLCRMKKSGCRQIMFIVEGARCLNRDAELQKCTGTSLCRYCRELKERHGPTVLHGHLEQVLRKLQTDHQCCLLFSRNYNETIDAIFLIRKILASSSDRMGKLLYTDFCSNARRQTMQDRRGMSLAKGDVKVYQADRLMTHIRKGDLRNLLHPQSSTPTEIVMIDAIDVDSSKPGKSDDNVIVLDGPEKPSAVRPQTIAIDIDTDDDDEIEILESPVAKKPQPANTRRQGTKLRETASGERRSTTLIVVQGTYEYDENFFGEVGKFWKAVYRSFEAEGTGTTFLTMVKNKLVAYGWDDSLDPPLVSRETFLFWYLYFQLKGCTAFHVSRTTDDDSRALQNRWRGINENSRNVTKTTQGPSTDRSKGIRGRKRRLSDIDVIDIDKPKTWSSGLPPVYSTPARTDSVREARLRRFDRSSQEKSFTSSNASSLTRSCQRAIAQQWQCESCSSMNDANVWPCTVCQSQNAITEHAVWNCERCTLENSSESRECIACSAPAPEPSAAVRAVSEDSTELPQYASTPQSIARTQRPPLSVGSSAGKKAVTCGACKQTGHTRATATAGNCAMFNHPDEVARREKKRQEAQEKAREKREEATRYAREAMDANQENVALRDQMAQLLQQQQRQTEEMHRMADAEAKRKRKAAERAEKRARRLGG